MDEIKLRIRALTVSEVDQFLASRPTGDDADPKKVVLHQAEVICAGLNIDEAEPLKPADVLNEMDPPLKDFVWQEILEYSGLSIRANLQAVGAAKPDAKPGEADAA